MPAQPDTTQLLLDARAGEPDSFDRLFSHLYAALRQIARQRLRRHGAGRTMGTTALVHESYLRLVDQSRAGLQDRKHFYAVASRAMHSILVDYARERSAQKRGGGAPDVPLDAVQVAADDRAVDVLELADALERLAAFDRRLSDIVQYRFFGGLTFEEIADTTGLSVPTVKRDWARARAWLYRAMQTAPASDA